MTRDLLRPLLELRIRRQLPEDDEIGRFEIRRMLCQLLDWIAAILEHALIAIDIRNAASTRRRVHERRIVRTQTLIVLAEFDLPKIGGANSAVGDGNFVQFAG